MGNTSSTKFTLCIICNPINIKSKILFGEENFTIDNVIISVSDLINTLPKIARYYAWYNCFYSIGLSNIVELIDANDANVISKCPLILVEFIRQFIALFRTYTIPKKYNTFSGFGSSLQFCLVAKTLMKQIEGCNILFSCTTVGAFFKYEKDIKILFRDITRLVYGKEYSVKIMFGVDAGDDISDLDKACYEIAGLPLPKSEINNSIC